MNKDVKCIKCGSRVVVLNENGIVSCYKCECNDVLGYELALHPHSTYMEFAEWCSLCGAVYYIDLDGFRYRDKTYTTPDLFQYWITNVKNKG